MKTAGRQPILGELRTLLREEEGLAASLIHASIETRDPREGVWLRRVAKGCVEHARTLRRHLGNRVGPVPGARAHPGVDPGDGRQDPLERAWAVCRSLARDYAWCTRQSVDRYLRMLLESLAEEHERLGRDLGALRIGETGFLREEEPAPILSLMRRARRGRPNPELKRVRRGA